MNQLVQARNKSKYENVVFLFIFAYVAVILGFISKNSPLYQFNDWFDLNAFETVGNSWIHGIIPYRDLFEQKGPVLYVIFAFASLTKGFFGTYLAEVICMGLTLTIFYKIGRLKLDMKMSLLFSLLSGTLITLSPFFQTGGSAEEFMFPGIAYSLYFITCALINKNQLSQKMFFFSGIAIAWMFWIKYTAIGGYVGIFIVLAVVLLFNRQFKKLILSLTSTLFGFMIISLPIILYFHSQHALKALWNDYFYTNIVLYPSNGNGLLGKFASAMHGLFHTLYGQPIIFVLLVGGIIYTSMSNNLFHDNEGRVLFLGSYMGMIVATLMGGKSWPYYFLTIIPYMLLPILGLFIDKKLILRNSSMWVLVMLLFVCTVGLSSNITSSKLFPVNATTDLHGVESETFQSTFARVINKRSNPTLLNYNSLDMGVYKASGVLPNTKFFEKQNIPTNKIPEMMNSQNAIIKNQKVDFVVTRLHYGMSVTMLPKLLTDNYKIVQKRDANVSGIDSTVYLLERNSNL